MVWLTNRVGRLTPLVGNYGIRGELRGSSDIFLFCDVINQVQDLLWRPAAGGEIFHQPLERLVAQTHILHSFCLPFYPIRVCNPGGIQPPPVAVGELTRLPTSRAAWGRRVSRNGNGKRSKALAPCLHFLDCVSAYRRMTVKRALLRGGDLFSVSALEINTTACPLYFQAQI